MRKIEKIVVHCTAGSQKQSATDIIRYHTGKGKNCLGWSAPGYHFIVEPSGKIVNTWPVEKISNGVKGHNSTIINVAWIGGLDLSKPMPYPSVDNRTLNRRQRLVKLLTELKTEFPVAQIVGHRDLSPDLNGNGVIDPWERIKDCPCFDAILEYAGL